MQYLAINSDRSIIDGMNPKDGGLRRIDNWCSHERAEHTTIRYRECSTIHVLDSKATITRLG